MKNKHTIIKGTLVLTIAGFISRIIGFYYRIFLSHTIGAEGIGIYQLIFPIYILCFSFSSAGIQVVISRLVAANASLKNSKTTYQILRIGLCLSLFFAAILSLFVYTHADILAEKVLLDTRCAPLLRIMSFCIPLGSIHSCIDGYYYGMKKAGIPAITQLTEQLVRVLSVYIIYQICIANHSQITVEIAVIGLVFGELASMLVSLTAFNLTYAKGKNNSSLKASPYTVLRNIIMQACPLTLNRVLINLLQSTEAILIPSRLRLYGLSTGESLSIYGILTGMALPLILFPSAFTNSVSVMLLPTVAEAQAGNKNKQITKTVENTIKYCLILGIFCTGAFLLLGKNIGNIVFHTESAGSFIVTLAWICPFLYLSSTLGSIVHGLGKTTTFFIYNTLSLLIRIAFVLFAIPKFGISGYLWGLLASQLLLTFLSVYLLNKTVNISFLVADWLLKPMAAIGISIFITNEFMRLFEQTVWMNDLLRLFAATCVITIVYFFCLIVMRTLAKPKAS